MINKVLRISPKPFIFPIILVTAIGLTYLYIWSKNPQSTVELKTPEGERVESIGSSEINSSSDSIALLKEQYKNKMTIIFFYDGFKSSEKALAYINVLKETLAIIEPFKSSQEMILYKTFTTDSQKCEAKNDQLICDEKLIESFRNLGADHFKVVILSPLAFSSNAESARGKNSWITVSTFQGEISEEEFNRFLGASFAQNLGRSLGLSMEETTGSTESSSYSKRPNCASTQEEAEDFWGEYTEVFDNIGYHQGCGGDSDSLYPERNTLMSNNPQKEGFGYVSEDYLRGAIQCFYGNKNVLSYQAGRAIINLDSSKNCESFKALYSNFWIE